MEATSKNPYEHLITQLTLAGKTYRYFDFNKLTDPRISQLPISVRVLLECAIRNCDGYNVTQKDVENIINWKETSKVIVTHFLCRLKFPSNLPGSSCRT